jgi:hypothetical protein
MGRVSGVKPSKSGRAVISDTAMNQVGDMYWYAEKYQGKGKGAERMKAIKDMSAPVAMPQEEAPKQSNSQQATASDSQQSAPVKLEPGTYIINGEVVEVQ